VAGSPAALLGLIEGEAPGAEPDWTEILRLARRHGLAGALHQGLSSGDGRVQPPAEVAELLRGHYRATALQNSVLLRESLAASQALTEQGIEHCFLKGIVLIGGAYDLGTRMLSDVDLLVKPAQAAAAIEVVCGLGYVPRDADPVGLAVEHGETTLHASGSWPEEVRPRIDLHSAMDYSRLHRAARARHPLADLLFRAPTRSAHGLPAPDPEAHWTVLLLHLLQHIPGRASVKWYLDLAALAGQGPLDWGRIAADLRAHRSSGAGWLVMESMRRELGTAFPPEIDGLFRPSARIRSLVGTIGPLKLLEHGRTFQSRSVGVLWRVASGDSLLKSAGELTQALLPREAWLRSGFSGSRRGWLGLHLLRGRGVLGRLWGRTDR
jgi:hypothetical protein